METQIKYYQEPPVQKPIMVCGLPGIGSVAWMAANHLQKELQAQLFAEIFSPIFSPKVWLNDDGVVRLMKGDFYFWKNSSRGGGDLILFTANEQPYSPEGQYELASIVLDLAEKFKVQRIITMGGMATDKFTDKPKVYVAATEVEFVKEMEAHGAERLVGGAITGTNGLIFGLAKPRKIPGICLLAETPGFLSLDGGAAKAILELFPKALHITVDLTLLEKEAKENREALQKASGPGREIFGQEGKKGGERDLAYVS